MAEQRRSASGAEAPPQGVAAVGRADILADFAGDLEAVRPEDRIHGCIARGQILAIPAPAGAQGDRRFIELELDGAAEAAPRDGPGHGHPSQTFKRYTSELGPHR